MRLIDADKLIERINGTGYVEQIKSNFLFIANMLPTVDAVEVVRCKDCKYFVKGRDWFSCQKWYMDIRKDDYCSYGERKENVD